MLSLLRQPLLKSVKIAQFGVKTFSKPIPRVLYKSYGNCRLCHQRLSFHNKTQLEIFSIIFSQKMDGLFWTLIYFLMFVTIMDDLRERRSNKKKAVDIST